VLIESTSAVEGASGGGWVRWVYGGATRGKASRTSHVLVDFFLNDPAQQQLVLNVQRSNELIDHE
jgi:hypothetical protein